ncbi:MAG: hypothetical protein ACLQOO_17245, partial [Terriglobia bacterium]
MLCLFLAPRPLVAQTAAILTLPASGATNVDPFQVFTWTAVPGASSYSLWIGTTPGGWDVYRSSYLYAPHVQPWGLIPGTTYYATLYTVISGRYYQTASQFQTAPAGLPDRSAFYSTVEQTVAQVRGMTIGTTGYPAPGTALAAEVSSLGELGANCRDFAYTLVPLLTQQRITARPRDITFNGASLNGQTWSGQGHTLPEYWDPFLNQWVVADPTFGVVYYNPQMQQGLGVEDISALVQQKNFAAIERTMTFVTGQGSYWFQNYWQADGLTLYLNPLKPGFDFDVPNNDPHPYLVLQDLSTVQGVFGYYQLEFAQPSDAVVVDNGSSGPQTFEPEAPTLWANMDLLYPNWFIPSPPAGLKVYTVPMFWTPASTLLEPANLAVNLNASNGLTWFTWPVIAGAIGYSLQLGSTQGGSDLYNGSVTTATYAGLQLMGQTGYWARLTTYLNGLS